MDNSHRRRRAQGGQHNAQISTQAPTANSHPDFFWHPRRDVRLLAPPLRHKYHDPPLPPSSESGLGGHLECYKRLPSLAQPQGESPSVILVGGWLAVLCISSVSICVTCASSVVRRDYFSSIHDGSHLDEGAVLICCDMCICRWHLRNFPWRDDST